MALLSRQAVLLGPLRMLVAPLIPNVFSVDSQDRNSTIRDDSRYSRAAFFWPIGCELAAFENMHSTGRQQIVNVGRAGTSEGLLCHRWDDEREGPRMA